MEKESILRSTTLKKRFCKDANLPISVFDEPYFSERLELYSILPQYAGCAGLFEEFCKELQKFPDEQSYFEYYNQVKEKCISDIKGTKCWQMFNAADMSSLFDYGEKRYPDRNLYSESNDGHLFISIDMRSANFSALKHFSKRFGAKPEDFVFGDAETWQEFISARTDFVHIIKSKYIRQVILGNCNPKRQTAYERCLMTKLAGLLENAGADIFSVTTDEIIIRADDFNENRFSLFKENTKLAMAPEATMTPDMLKIEWFRLEKLKDTSGWLKKNPSLLFALDDIRAVEVKCLEAELFPQVIRYLALMDVTENDLVFCHNGKLARFLEPIAEPFD